MTPAARMYLSAMMARHQKEANQNVGSGSALRVEILATCIEDPTAAVEDYLRELSQAEFGPLPRPEPRPETGGRRECCRDMLMRMNSQLGSWRYPQTVQCPDCQAVYEIAPTAIVSDLTG
jgi:hypothetical protein